MHFTGRTWRPPYEASSLIIEATAGCTYNKCSFCNLYQDECFKMTPMERWRKDLAEIATYQPNARRLFWTGANPFAMSYERLKQRALAVYDYLPKCQTIAMFASINDIKNKKVWQLKQLKKLGINGLTIGVESGDNNVLKLANKGYNAKDIIDQCRKLDLAKIEYYFVYMTGLAGKDGGKQNAINSAKVFNKINPRFISVDSLTLFRNTKLYDLSKQNKFIIASEKERIKELQIFINHLQLRVHLFANSSSNFYPTTAYLPRDRDFIISELQNILDTTSEQEMQEYRQNLKSLG